MVHKKPRNHIKELSPKEMNLYYLLAEIEIAQNQLRKAISILTDTAELTTIKNKWYRLIHYRLEKFIVLKNLAACIKALPIRRILKEILQKKKMLLLELRLLRNCSPPKNNNN